MLHLRVGRRLRGALAFIPSFCGFGWVGEVLQRPRTGKLPATALSCGRWQSAAVGSGIAAS